MATAPASSSHALDRRTALALGAAATILYLVTAPAIPNLDGLGYIKLLPHNFAAGHLLFMPALRALTHLVGDGLRAGRLYDAILGGTGVVVTYSIARRMLAAWSDEEARLGAAFAAGGLALSYGYWSEANDVEAYAAAMVALLLTVRMAQSYAAQPSLARAAATGALLGVAVLSHLSHVLLAVYVAYDLHRHARTRRWLPPALALAVGGALSIALYAWAALVVRGHDLHGALKWIATAQHGFVTTGGAYRLADAVYGLCKAIVWSPYLYEADAQKLVGQLLLGLIPLAALFVGALQSRRAPNTKIGRVDVAGLAVWCAPYALLGVVFFGADPERWIFILPAGWILAAALVLQLPRPSRAIVAVLLWIGAFNLGTAVWPAHRDQWPRQKAELTAALLHDGDLLIFPGHSWDEYVVYYGSAKVEPFPLSYYAARDGADAAWARLDKEIGETRAHGGRVFCVRIFNDADEDPRGFWELGTVGISRTQLKDAIARRGRPVTIVPTEGLTVTRLEP